MSCLRSGFCEVIGSYEDQAGNFQSVAQSRPAGGTWKRGVEVGAPAGAAANPDSFFTSLACTGVGNCVAVGSYTAASPDNAEQAMGAIEVRGKWRRARRITLPADALASPGAIIQSISCAKDGTCVGVGRYSSTTRPYQAISVTESHRRFSAAKAVAAAPAGATGPGKTYLDSVSCLPDGTCVAIGGYTNATGIHTAMYVDGVARHPGRWGKARAVRQPFSGEQSAALYAVSCTGARVIHCTTVGYYRDAGGDNHGEAASTG